MQGFPSMYGFHAWFPEIMRKRLYVPENFTQYLGGYDEASYWKEISELLLHGVTVENVILLEIKPFEQKTSTHKLLLLNIYSYLAFRQILTLLVQPKRRFIDVASRLEPFLQSLWSDRLLIQKQP